MFKSLRARVGLVLMVVVVLSVLAVPAASAGTLAAPSERASGSQLGANNAGGWGCSQYYVVRRGDNLTRIAYHYGTTVNALMRCNNIWNPDVIYWGQRLCICGAYNPPPAPKPAPKPAACRVPCPAPCPASCAAPAPAPAPAPCGRAAPCPAPAPAPCGPPAKCGFCSDQRAIITSPGQNAHVSGWLTITGNATHENFKFYKLEYGAGSNPTDWHWFFGGEWPIWHGTLGGLNTDLLEPGTYTIRLTVVDQTSNYPPPCQVTIVVC